MPGVPGCGPGARGGFDMSWHETIEKVRDMPIDLSQAVADLLSANDYLEGDWMAFDMLTNETSARTVALHLVAFKKVLMEIDRRERESGGSLLSGAVNELKKTKSICGDERQVDIFELVGNG